MKAHPALPTAPGEMRALVLVLGDQLWLGHPALAALDRARDRVLLIEAPGEATQPWSHQARIALFLSAMRHFCNALHRAGLPWAYMALDDTEAMPGLLQRLEHALLQWKPQRLRVVQPGEWRLEQGLREVAARAGVALEILEDTHFLCSRPRFERWAQGRREFRLEHFYREMRREHGVLMEGRNPVGGAWNFDADNRKAYPKAGPGAIPPPARFEPDETTREVFALVRRHFGNHPGSLDHFAWPVTREQALEALQRFIDARLAQFGPWQDAMWTGEAFGWHSLLSVALNLHLITPLEVVRAAEAAYHAGHAPLASVEGFIRQVMGWREFVRGMYWLDMPGMAQANHYGHQRPLPGWYWTGQTQMACLRDAIGQTLAHGYAHHIQRLMVTGQFALLAGLDPQAVAAWYLGIYVDAVEWVELPNVAGMALFADGGRFTSKPYVASGQYIKRMSNHCEGCRYRPEQRTGDGACPYTTLYWHFLDRHHAALASQPRTALMARSVERLSAGERAAIARQAEHTLERLESL